MKSVLLSIQPRWCELIASGKKTVEVRKTKPKLETPFKVYIYCTTDKRLLHKFDKGERIDDEHFFNEHVFVRQNTWIRGHFNPNKKVIGEFVCRNKDFHSISNLVIKEDAEHTLMGTCLEKADVLKYIGYQNGTNIYEKPYLFYGWHISDLVIYDKPRELSEFKRVCDGNCQSCQYAIWQTNGWAYEPYIVDCKPITRPPQSWCYVESVD